MARLENKIAIVTGAASGLGKATAALFVSEGARVVLSDINVESGRAAAASIGERAEFRRHDVTADGDWMNLVNETVQKFGRLDILVNNAGVLPVGNIESQTVEQWDWVNAVVAKGVFLGCRHAVRVMKNAGGAIVNVSSIASLQGMPYAVGYAAAKGAVESLTRSVAVHCVEMRYAIRCNSVHPGTIDTPMVHAVPAQMEAIKAAGFDLAPRRPITHYRANPEDIAESVLYLASDASRAVNGTRLVVDNCLSVMSVISGIASVAGELASEPAKITL